jgi:hypothetical protein
MACSLRSRCLPPLLPRKTVFLMLVVQVLSHFSRCSYFFETVDTCSFTADSRWGALMRQRLLIEIS